MLGLKAARLLFPGRPLLGETITINGTSFLIIGMAGKISRGDNDWARPACLYPRDDHARVVPGEGGQHRSGCADLDPISAHGTRGIGCGAGGSGPRDSGAAPVRSLA